MPVMFPVFRAFTKPAGRPAKTRCELKAWSMEIGVGSRNRVRLAYFDVAPTLAYTDVIEPATKSGERVQVGLEFADGRRIVLTGKVAAMLPTMVGTELLHRVRMDVATAVRSRRRRAVRRT